MAKKRQRRTDKRAKAPTERAVTEAEAREGGGAPSVPHWLPAAVFVGLTLLLFRAFVFSDQMIFGGDTLGLGYVARAFYADALTGLGSFPLWAPMILGGIPFVEALASGDSLYPPSVLLLLVMEPYRALGWKLVLHFAAAGFFMFGWTRQVGASRAASLLAGTAYMLAPYFVSLVQPGHDGKIFVTALAPLLFWTVERHFLRPSVNAFTAVALVVALVIYTTHFQMAYFLFGAVGLYAVYRSVQMRRSAPPGRRAASRFGLFLAASVVGAGVAAVQFVPAVDYVSEYSRRIQTTRAAAGETGVEWSSSWSLHPEEVMALVIPEFAGNNSMGADWSQGTYWGRNATRDNHSGAGVLALLLAATAFAGGRQRGLRFFLAGLGALALLFALGAHTPVWRVFYEVVPGIRLFRAPDQVMFLFAFAVATLAALGLDRILTMDGGDAEGAKPVMKILWVGVALLGVLAALASSGTLTSVWTATIHSGIEPNRLAQLDALEPYIVRGAWVTFFLGLAAVGLVHAARAGYLAPAGVVAGLLLLVGIDELRISSGFIQVLDFEEWSAPDPNEQAVLDREADGEEPYRLLSFRRNAQDVQPALHGIELAAGHHPNDLSRYRELIGMVGSGVPTNLLDQDIRRLLNVRYILWPDRAFGQSLGGIPVLSRTQAGGAPYESVHVEPDLPRARLVGSAIVKSDAEAVAYMLSTDFDPEREVVLAAPPPIDLDGEPAAGTVAWRERSPNRLVLSVASERPALLVVADNWFPAWRATVDGTDAPVLRAYHTLRAVPVPAGDHTVEMVYDSPVVRSSLWLSLLLFTVLVAATLLTTWKDRVARRTS